MGISIWQLLIVLVIVLVLFGAKRLRNIGSDLGAAVKGFKQAMNNDEAPEEKLSAQEPRVINGESSKEKEQR